MDKANVLLDGNVTGLPEESQFLRYGFADTNHHTWKCGSGLLLVHDPLLYSLVVFLVCFYDISFSFSKSPQMDQKKFLPIALQNRLHVYKLNLTFQVTISSVLLLKFMCIVTVVTHVNIKTQVHNGT